jgi:hypothetical protein
VEVKLGKEISSKLPAEQHRKIKKKHTQAAYPVRTAFGPPVEERCPT